MALGQVMVYIIDYNSYIPMVSIMFNTISNVVPKKKDLNTIDCVILLKGALETAQEKISSTTLISVNNVPLLLLESITITIFLITFDPFYFKYNDMRSVYFKVYLFWLRFYQLFIKVCLIYNWISYDGYGYNVDSFYALRNVANTVWKGYLFVKETVASKP